MISIIETLYSKYSILFIFNNIINHLIYIKDILYINKIYKKTNCKQIIFYNK